MNKNMRLKDHVSTLAGKNWFDNAGAWADEAIMPSPIPELRHYVTEVVRVEDCRIDPRNIAGTTHAAYNQGMTWREFLGYGNRIATKLEVLETKPEYYTDPKKFATDSEPWGLYEIDGKLYTNTGNHRSVVAKFRAHEEGVTSQLVWYVDRITISTSAIAAYEELQQQYLPGDRDFGPEHELISDEAGRKKYQIYVHCCLHSFTGGATYKVPLENAVAFVRERNKYSRKFFRIWPRLWNRIFG